MTRIEKATKFAEDAHEGQTRKYTGAPYVVHPKRVAERARVQGEAEDVVVAALLHDTVEDTEVTKEQVAQEFGENVASMVAALTEERPAGMNRRQRLAAYFDRLSRERRDVKVLKLLDRLDNLNELDPASGFTRLYARESLLLAEAVGDADEPLRIELVKTAESLLA